MRAKTTILLIVVLLAIPCLFLAIQNARSRIIIIASSSGKISLPKKEVANRGGRDRVNKEVQQVIPVKSEHKNIIAATFNIRHGVDAEKKESLETIIREIKDSGAQIVALQEVDRYMARSGFQDQVKQIADALSYHFAYGETINILGVKYGNALISAYPILDYENIKLPSTSLEKRGLLKAKVLLGQDIYHFFVTHLGLSAEEREQQIQRINHEIGMEIEKVILLGDFNAEKHFSEMQGLPERLKDTALFFKETEYPTYAYFSSRKNVRIDYIFVSEDIRVKRHWVNPSQSSDHSMVLTEIRPGLLGEEGSL